ncbi:MAG TPA: histidine kinase [Mycobacteriales bacterium]|jgi:signal transduction histidine kinase
MSRTALVGAGATVVALLVVRLLGLGYDGPLTVLLLAPSVVAYLVGVGARLWFGLVVVLVLTAGLQSTNATVNPFFAMITIGPWLIGRAVQSDRTLAGRLSARNADLRAEGKHYREESLRYERARIARELHDVVAHSLSLIVVQASAGQRLPDGDRAGLAETLHCIARAADQAGRDLDGLIAPLAHSSGIEPPGLDKVAGLARLTSGSGVAVSCRISGRLDGLSPAASAAGYRMVQEALTNAVKHAPGSPVDIRVREIPGAVEVTVVNATPRDPVSGLASSGSGRGLAGMRERLAACGGQLAAGPVPAGGWRVAGILPAAVGASPSRS